MSYCPGLGASEIQPSVTNTAIAFAGGALSLALIEVLPPPFNVIAAGYIGAITFDLATFCTHDPPPMPTTAELATAALGLFGSPTARLAAILTFTDFVGASSWSTYCQCVTGPQPTPPAAPAAPTGLPTAPGVSTTATPCLEQADSGEQAFTGTVISTWAGATYPSFLSLPSGATSIAWSTQLDVVDNVHPSGRTTHLIFYASDHATILGTSQNQTLFAPAVFAGGLKNWSPSSGFGVSPPAGQTFVELCLSGQTVTLPAGTAYVSASYTEVHAASTDITNVFLAVYCGGATPGGTSCCPDLSPVITALTQIQATLNALLESQPSLGVTSYAAGTVHAGLTSYGNLTFTDEAIGLKVNLSSVGSGIGYAVGDPLIYFDAGWITLVTEQGPLAPVRVQADGQFIPFPALVVSADYTFSATVTATITEITAGP